MKTCPEHLRRRPYPFDGKLADLPWSVNDNISFGAALSRRVRLLLCPSVAAVIHNPAGKLLLQEKASGEGWSLPVGAIEPGETPEQAIIREVAEETGLVVAPVGILGVFGGKDFRYTYPNGDHVEYVVTLFKCRIVENDGTWTDSETQSLGYFGEDEMPPLALPYPRSVLYF